ncbi:hydrogen gas-evolving membrane-bound hydrogenase subunit E [Vibrio sp. CAU 1672]|uniref:hydrogen gas-evolving membrane-bound hydrogenase subunit E n=1 Tax=Vibrio sp. CAU 1672 TaxID=3032594 RepID=UPI0023DCAAC9|nr:hydrogen gas-evolving membrane-bound hydrogenase subunit E [Vibrio sp. CAU 1672]MDF2153838.1 proton-conducting transporter membrane subunit [Vibrio sp. CAU 1672]
MGVDFSIRLDGLSMLFAGLICAIGAMVQFYAMSYMRDTHNQVVFHLYLSLFMLAMLGLVLSDNIILLFVFWELTTLTSYLLIGYQHQAEKSRQSALQAMLVTGAGGLALLAGLIMLGSIAGSYELSVIFAQASAIKQHPLYLPSLILLLAGAFTKSAQFPFHFWLPSAMAAPTPVSAYLHSATMVKAGIYLLARMSPIYADSEVWSYALGITGGATAVWAALLAVRQTDLKLMLAYSTNSALGKLTLLLALGTETAITAALLFILAHAFYKAALFMVVGNIDKATGTREIAALSGLRAWLVFSFVAAAIAALSKAGLPPLLGFLSKEYMYKAGLETTITGVVTLLVVNGLMGALALRLVLGPFFTGNDKPATCGEVKRIESDIGFWLPPMLLALASVAVPLIGLSWLQLNLISPGLIAVSPQAQPMVVKLWHGFNLPLLLSGVTVLVAGLLYHWLPHFSQWLNRWMALLPSASSLYQKAVDRLIQLAGWQTRLLQAKRLSVYVLVCFAVLTVLLLSRLPGLDLTLADSLREVHFYEVGIALILISGALLCVVSSRRLLSVSALGGIGFMTTLVFMLYSAPDVAKTLLLVETLIVVFLALLLRHLPTLGSVIPHSRGRRLFNALIAIAIGVSVTLLLMSITASPLDMRLPDYFAHNSVPSGHGRNIVNVILVDFRALDTLGEALVVVIAAMSAAGLVKGLAQKADKVQSLIFSTTAHIVAVIMMVFSFYLLLRGHNAPGGGFIGALIAVIGLSLLMFSESTRYVKQRLRYPPLNVALFGILLALFSGGVSLLQGLPFLTGLWWLEGVKLGTPLLFDIGIYFAVVGAVMTVLLRVNEELG